MANHVYVGDSWTFTHDGREFRATVHRDDDMGAPWEEHDGHCPVRRVAHDYGIEYGQSKAPAEYVFHRGDRREWSYCVDMQECISLALADGWGAPDEEVARFVAKHGRQPTKREEAVLAVRADLEYLRGWCADYWCWVFLEVQALDDDGEPCGDSEYLSGLKSCSGDYIRDDVAHELASQINIPENAFSLGTDE
jgi:hypothetical protein